MVNKCCKFRGDACNGFEKKWIDTKNLTKILSKKGPYFLQKPRQSYVLLSVDGGNDGEKVL